MVSPPMTDTFRSLFMRARSGDRDARDLLLAEHLPGLRAFVRAKTGPALRAREAASDLVQTVCREVLADLDTVECSEPVEFQRWLYAVALHKIVRKAEYHAAEKRSPRREAAQDDDGLLQGYASICRPSEVVSSREQVARIERALDALSEDDRDVIVQARLLGMPSSEIASATGRSDVAVRKHLSRARARLALLLDVDSGNQ